MAPSKTKIFLIDGPTDAGALLSALRGVRRTGRWIDLTGQIAHRRPPRRALLATATTLATLLLLALATSAPALAGKGVLSTFGSAGSGDAQFASAGATAVNRTSGDVYVIDSPSNRVEQFDSAGAFIRAWGWGVADGKAEAQVCTSGCQAGLPGAGEGQLAEGAQGIAVDQASQAVYVVDSANSRVEKFSAAGSYESQFGTAGNGDGQFTGPEGIAIDPTDQSIYVADSGDNRIEKFDKSGAYLSQFGSEGSADGQFSSPTRVAVDSTGLLYVLDAGNFRVERFTKAGVFEEHFDPTDVFFAQQIATGPEDHLYVGQYSEDFSEQRVIELDQAGTLIATDGVGSTASNISGLAVAAAAKAIYLADGANARVFILADLTPASATIDPVANVTSSTAELSGTVTPNGPPAVGWHFETSTDDASWSPVAAAQDAGAGNSPVAVSASLSGLVANTTYFVRLVATRAFNSPPTFSAEVQFATGALAPTGSTQPADDLSPTHATLEGLVNPQHASTSYYFQWGPTTSYGASLPATQDADAGSGAELTQVLQQLNGLQPASTYHYRLIAANLAGTLTGQDQTFTTPSALPASTPRFGIPGTGFLPDDRGWELVSPTDKNGADIMGSTVRTRAAATETPDLPMAATFSSLGGFADEQGSGIAGEYMAIRDATPGTQGWATHGITPPQNSMTYLDGLQFFDPLWEGELSADLTHGVFRALSPLTDSPAVAHVENLYVRDDLRTPGHGSYQLASDCSACGPTPLPTSFLTQQLPRLAGASADFGHVLFEAVQPLVPGATAIDDINSATFAPNLYDWDHGTLRLAGILPDSACATPPCIPPGSVAGRGAGAGAGGPSHSYTLHTISSDGSRIFFSAGGDLYMRADHAVTVKINASEKTPPDTPQPATFQTASTDGSRVFFTTQEQLTNDDTNGAIDLYMYDANAPVDHRLTRLSVDHEPADQANAVGVIGASNDGHYVYFIASGQLVAGEPTDLHGPVIYEWHDGTLSYIGQLADPGDDISLNVPGIWENPLGARVAPDGRHLMFLSHSGNGLIGYGHGNTCTPTTFAPSDGPCGELYVYSADSHRLACASCNPSGARATANARVSAFEGTAASNQTWHLNHALSDDGRRVFFSSAEALVAGDTNNKVDAYEYDVPSGTVHLLSSGTDPSNSFFMDASANGDDAFFVTRQQLVGWDNDQGYDLYDARVGGGLPEPAAPAPPCTDQGCHGQSPAPSGARAPASSQITAAGNLTAPLGPPAGKAPAKLTRAQRLRAALKACRRGPHRLRHRCEAQARRRYGPKARSRATSRPSRHRGR